MLTRLRRHRPSRMLLARAVCIGLAISLLAVPTEQFGVTFCHGQSYVTPKQPVLGYPVPWLLIGKQISGYFDQDAARAGRMAMIQTEETPWAVRGVNPFVPLLMFVIAVNMPTVVGGLFRHAGADRMDLAAAAAVAVSWVALTVSCVDYETKSVGRSPWVCHPPSKWIEDTSQWGHWRQRVCLWRRDTILGSPLFIQERSRWYAQSAVTWGTVMFGILVVLAVRRGTRVGFDAPAGTTPPTHE